MKSFLINAEIFIYVYFYIYSTSIHFIKILNKSENHSLQFRRPFYAVLNIKKGEKLPKTTAIDLVLGNGNRPGFVETEEGDSLPENETEDSSPASDLNF